LRPQVRSAKSTSSKQASKHIGYYERFGFKEIALTSYLGGDETKVYEAGTIAV
jgi:hypothetical protein